MRQLAGQCLNLNDENGGKAGFTPGSTLRLKARQSGQSESLAPLADDLMRLSSRAAMTLLDRRSSARRMILARITSQYGDVCFLATDSSACRSLAGKAHVESAFSWHQKFPYNAKLRLNGHEYAKQQLSQRGIGLGALDNGILSCEDPRRLQAICDDSALPDLHSAGGVLADTGSGPSGNRPGVFRGSDPRKAQDRRTQAGAVDLRSSHQPAYARQVPHTGNYLRGGFRPCMSITRARASSRYHEERRARRTEITIKDTGTSASASC